MQIQQGRFKSKGRKAIFFLLMLTGILLFPVDFYAIESPLIQYLNQKALSNYEKAIEIIEEWSVIEKDPIIIETNIFRIYELIKYPELIEKAIGAYKGILENKAVQNIPVITARINIFLNILYLRKGSMREASHIKESLGFISKYRISGWFKSEDFNQSFLSEDELSIDDSEKTYYKMLNTDWFNTQADPTGKLDAADLMGDVTKSVFYFKSSIYVPADGKLCFMARQNRLY